MGHNVPTPFEGFFFVLILSKTVGIKSSVVPNDAVGMGGKRGVVGRPTSEF